MLAKFGHIESIPSDAAAWQIANLRGAEKLAATLRDQYDNALLFRQIATVMTDIDVGAVDDWCWRGPTDDFVSFAADLGAPQLSDRAVRLAENRFGS